MVNSAPNVKTRSQAPGFRATARIVDRRLGLPCAIRSPASPRANVGRRRPHARARLPTVSSSISSKPAPARAAVTASGSLHAPTSGWASAAVSLISGWMPSASAVRDAEVCRDERVAPVHGRDDERSARPEPAVEVPERRSGVGEMLHREVRQHDLERAFGERCAVAAQVDGRELVEIGERRRRGMDVDANEAIDPVAERDQRRRPSATGVEHRDVPGRARRRGIDRRPECSLQTRGDRRLDAEPLDQVVASSLRGGHQAVAVAASVMPCDSSQRSASMAALQPSAAAVTACR